MTVLAHRVPLRVRCDHVSFTVRDLEVSRRFWCQGFDFAFVSQSSRPGLWRSESDPSGGAAYERLTLQRPELILEFLCFDPPALVPSSPTLRREGSTHLGFQVEDLAAARNALAELGSRDVGESVANAHAHEFHVAFCEAPDGILFELFQPITAARTRPGSAGSAK